MSIRIFIKDLNLPFYKMHSFTVARSDSSLMMIQLHRKKFQEPPTVSVF